MLRKRWVVYTSCIVLVILVPLALVAASSARTVPYTSYTRLLDRLPVKLDISPRADPSPS